MFGTSNEEGYLAVLPGIRRKTLVWGENTLMTEFLLEQGSRLPPHAHPHEQTGYLVSGALRLRVGAEERDLGPGDTWCITGGTEHEALALDAAVAVEVFAPLREDYLPG